MKLQIVGTLAALIGSTKANWSKINALFLQLEEAAYNKTVADNPELASDRGFTPFILDKLQDIQFYGCWCYLDATWDQAKGPVQDGLDQECKNLVQNYRCLVLDALDRGETCDPEAQEYIEYNLFSSQQDLVVECETNGNQNGDPQNNNQNAQCMIDLCKADGEFTLNLFALMFQTGGIAASNPPYDPNVAHSSNVPNPGTFDPAIECATNLLQGAGRSDKECCGEYPTRFPFKTFNGDKDCCGGQTYSTLALQCCLAVPVGNGKFEDQIHDINNACP